MTDLVVKNGRLVCPDEIKAGTLVVEDGRIVAILPPGESVEANQVLDAQNCYVLPGGIDSHVHFNDPGYTWREDFSHGSKAAAKGGITTVVDMPLQNLPPVSSARLMKKKAAIAAGKSYVDFALWGALLRTNREDLAGMQEAGAAAFKCFMCDPGKDYTDLQLAEIRDRLMLLKEIGGLAGFHCEDYAMLKSAEQSCLAAGKTGRSDYLAVHSLAAERKAVSDIIELVREIGASVHICHVSHPAVADVIRQAKKEGLPVTAETCMHYLLLTEEDLLQHGAVYKCSPPLRKREDADALWEYVADGTLDIICSDHSPCQLPEKGEEGPKGIFGAWGGISGVQTTLQACWNYTVEKRQASPLIVAKVMAENPAGIFGFADRKGQLAVGKDADFTILDPAKEWQIEACDLEYRNKFSAFCGCKGKGLPVATYLRGQCSYQDNSFAPVPRGEFIPVSRGGAR
ncbi:MAG: allantoinase AllB [Selenomonadaceae bacterium]|nr:allantoinase AllB [Selenomonadaceae bacterium]